MSILTDWITNIILFILLAVVIDLLLPNSTMQKYAKVVISLLLIVVIINPIFKLFSTDMDQLLAEIQLESSYNEDEGKNLIDLQKKEIQASQRAYILNYMAVQMEKQAEKELVQNYDVTISQILPTFSEQDTQINSQSQPDHIEVTLQHKPEEAALETVQMVEIDASKNPVPKKDTQKTEAEEIAAYLANIWEVEAETITVHLEGGRE
ncbi:stage III sporulation protein AF [Metabacillus herbersteinensis]|uniref:Stage III sporulation protein AF n=1 Tax=Metabacillus herbersteinensis TaxID=283816 RepID=A0ABV6G8C1_9BACI